jgi:hypothetical protein
MVLAHALAGLCVLATVPAPAGPVIALLACALGAASCWRVALLRSPASPVELEIQAGRILHARLRGGGSIEASGAPRHVSRHWVVVPVASGSVRRILVMADMLGAGDFRHLRVWALWGGVAGSAPVPELF